MTAIFISFLVITIVNILAYIWAYKNQSDHLTDISYSLCFIVTTLYFLFFTNDGILSSGRLILSLMVVLWGMRLGGFLFYRIRQMGKDVRFDDFRGSKFSFLKFWLLQSISICIIALPIIIGLNQKDLSINYGAVSLWAIGFVIESVADYQKFEFRKTKKDKAFIDYGLYTYVRHPNYLGEILIWTANFWYVFPSVSGLEWILILLSPIWVIILLVWISGIPLLEKTNITKYKNNSDFLAYTQRTWRLIPWVY